ncbi:MAG: hypothetical protein HOJ35_05160 [Bdellovibrionales bacterium]|jgi:hypothetical protein|nr:hypothetical protein [Bdellovibrionales bacterium]
MSKYSLVLLLILSSFIQASELHNSIILGELDNGVYSGNISPHMKINLSNGSIRFIDSNFREKYINRLLSVPLADLSSYWFDDFISERECPNLVLQEHKAYIQYLHRLIIISYLYEYIKREKNYLYQMGSLSGKCSTRWEDIFNECRPIDHEMKKFISRAKIKTDKIDSLYKTIKFTKSEKQLELKRINTLLSGGKTSKIIDLALQDQCIKTGCSHLSWKEIRSAINNSCEESKNLIIKVCNEKDKFFGGSYLKELKILLKRSNAFKIINKHGHGIGCLGRYTKLFSRHEAKHYKLRKIFLMIMKELVNEKAPYLQGELFVLGALKEFDDIGVKNILATYKKQKKIVLPVPQDKHVKKIIKKKKVAKRIVEVSVPKVKKKTVTKKAITLSQFELACKKHLERKEKITPVDMEKMKSDFIFTDQMIVALSSSLDAYLSRVGLTQMKKYDFLGTRKEPVTLMFLKFLIENDYHQGLHNMVAVLGDKFWVLNDIDNKTNPKQIKLSNNKSTNYRWQIDIAD